MIGGMCVCVCVCVCVYECALLERWVYFCVTFPALALSCLTMMLSIDENRATATLKSRAKE